MLVWGGDVVWKGMENEEKESGKGQGKAKERGRRLTGDSSQGS